MSSSIKWSPQINELNVFSMPFLMPDINAIDARRGGVAEKDLFKILSGKDVAPLAWGKTGFLN